MKTYSKIDKNCRYCEGTGVYYQPNGEDDFDALECHCKTYVASQFKDGQRVFFETPSREESIKRVLTELYF